MGKKNFEARIGRSLLEAKHFFERNLIAIENEAGIYYGFPVAEGKKRITEWGATGAGLKSLLSLGAGSPDVNSKCENAKRWLLQQQKDGAWEASDFFSAEATAGVLLNLISVKAIEAEPIGRAIDFINSCYRDGFYSSTPCSTEKPHIYTTYLVTRCLATYGRLEKRTEIRDWLMGCQVSNGRWGRGPDTDIYSPIHTIYSYQILQFCGMDKDELLSQYEQEIRQLFKETEESGYIFEEIEVQQDLSDSSGSRYFRLRIQHFVAPALGRLSIMIGEKRTAFRVANRLIEQQFAGGWGPSNDELVMWATEQSVEYLQLFRDKILGSLTLLESVSYSFAFVPYHLIKAIIALIGLIIFVIFLLIPGYRESSVVGLFFVIGPWFFSRHK